MALLTRPATTRGSLTQILVVTCLALATVVSTVASLNVALPSILRATNATQTELSWVVDAYALVFAALLLVGGALGDRYGRRRALLVGLGVFAAGSVASVVVDCESGPVRLGLAARLAGDLGGAAVTLDELRADSIAGLVKEVQGDRQRNGQGSSRPGDRRAA